jgi:hypothetical protein
MANKQIANLKFTVDPAALREIVSSGQLLEFANATAAEAASQIKAQLVQHVAEGALNPEGLKGGASVELNYVMMDGPGYGTGKPPVKIPHVTVVVVPNPFPFPGL